MAEIIDGKKVSAHLREQISADVLKFKQVHGVTPGLAVVLVGDNPASMVYVRNKHKACLECGINSFEITFPADISEADLLAEIARLNLDNSVHGILVQLPLPRHINEDKVINAIDPNKDVDAFHPTNVGKIMTGKYDFLPCTPAGIMSLLDYYGIELDGKNCVVVGRSNIVGKPMAHLLLERNATVTVCHSHTADLASFTRNADVVVVAVGRAEFLKADMIKPSAVVIDVGINRLDNGKLVGDVAFDEVAPLASFITPVPGGVGPMTITTLLRNAIKSAERFI